MPRAKQPGPVEPKWPRLRRWLRIVLWSGILVSSAFAAHEVRSWVLADPRFVITGNPADTVEQADFLVEGVSNASRQRVVKVFQADFGKNIFLIPISERRRRLLAIDWIADASVSRIWPNRLMVSIRERKPVAFVNLSRDPSSPHSRLALIDAEGVILEKPDRGNFSFPVLQGVYEQQPEPERKRRVQQMLRLTSGLGKLEDDISEVDVSSRELRVTMNVSGSTVDLLLGERDFKKKIEAFLTAYPRIHKGSPKATSFDLRLDDRIIAVE